MLPSKTQIFSKIEQEILSFHPENIIEERREILQPLIDYIQIKVSNNDEVRLNFICTHNSRRSHFSQVWAQVAASYFNFSNVFCYSGGTESTALFPVVATTLSASGFKISKLSQGDNPVYGIKYTDNEHPIIGFSKKFDDQFNPKAEFAAILTCSSADQGCPFIAGAEKRIPITFEDPKVYDGTEQQTEKYQERSMQIATELFYVFSQIKK
jgi:arsenate reductase